MRGMNVCQIMGNLGADPELRYTPTGRAVANFRVAVNRRWRDAEGDLQQKVEWFRVTAWGRTAELVNQYCAKGYPVYVTGRLETRSFEGADGQTRYLTELVAQDVLLLPRGNGSADPAEEAAEVEEEELAEVPL